MNRVETERLLKQYDKHHDAMRAFAAGEDVQVESAPYCWVAAPNPTWDASLNFRVKPQPQVQDVPLGHVFDHGGTKYLRIRTTNTVWQDREAVACLRLQGAPHFTCAHQVTHFKPDGETPVTIIGPLDQYLPK